MNVDFPSFGRYDSKAYFCHTLFNFKKKKLFFLISDLTNDSKPTASNINTEQTKFNRIERKHNSIEQRPFRFPTIIEESRAYESNLIRWPVDQPSNFANIETAARHGNHLSPPPPSPPLPSPQQWQQQQQRLLQKQLKHLVRFPTPQTESENDASLSEHINFVTESFIGPVSLNNGPTIAAATATTEAKAAISRPSHSTPNVPSLMHQNAPNNYYGIQIAGNDVDNETSTVNQAATVNTMHGKPMIYIPDEHRKNATKNASTANTVANVSNNRHIECVMFEALALPSINCTAQVKTPIISNENGKLTTAQYVSIPNVVHNTNAIADDERTNVLFSTQMAINLTNTHIEHETNQMPLSRKEPKLYNGLPIFV